MNDLLPQLFACSSSPLAATLPALPLMSVRGRGAVEAVGRAAALNYWAAINTRQAWPAGWASASSSTLLTSPMPCPAEPNWESTGRSALGCGGESGLSYIKAGAAKRPNCCILSRAHFLPLHRVTRPTAIKQSVVWCSRSNGTPCIARPTPPASLLNYLYFK